MALRDFLYLDRTLVRDFLAQAEGGQIDEETSRANTSGNLGGKLHVGVSGAGATASANKGTTSETEMVIRQVGPSEFERLYNHLDGIDELTLLETADELDEVASIKRQRFVEVDGKLKAAGLGQLMTLIAQLGTAMKQVQALGSTVTIDTEAAGIFAMAEQLSMAPRSTTMILSVPGDLGFQVGLELNPDFILSSDLDVDASALIKVQRVLRTGEKRVLGDPFGGLLSKMPQDQLEGMVKALQEGDAASTGLVPDIELRAPAILATPIAVWR